MGSSAGTCTISHYSGTGTTTTVRDGGTLQNKITVSIVAASQGGTAYAPYSYAKLDSSQLRHWQQMLMLQLSSTTQLLFVWV
jgi:hypothetical protein